MASPVRDDILHDLIGEDDVSTAAAYVDATDIGLFNFDSNGLDGPFGGNFNGEIANLHAESVTVRVPPASN